MSSLACFAFEVVILSLLLYPVLRSLALQLHAALTGSYVSGTHSIAFINCLNEQIAKDIARYRDASPACLLGLFESSFLWRKPFPVAREELYVSGLLCSFSLHSFSITYPLPKSCAS